MEKGSLWTSPVHISSKLRIVYSDGPLRPDHRSYLSGSDSVFPSWRPRVQDGRMNSSSRTTESIDAPYCLCQLPETPYRSIRYAAAAAIRSREVQVVGASSLCAQADLKTVGSSAFTDHHALRLRRSANMDIGTMLNNRSSASTAGLSTSSYIPRPQQAEQQPFYRQIDFGAPLVSVQTDLDDMRYGQSVYPSSLAYSDADANFQTATTTIPSSRRPHSFAFDVDENYADSVHNLQTPTNPRILAQSPAAAKVFPCASCGKGFARRSDLARHERIHSGIRPHACEHPGCGKEFIQRSALTVHTRVHTGEKPHMCERCGKPFSDSSSLARHRRIHSGKRPYKCPYADCQKTFTRRTTLTRHQGHHSGTVEEAAAATAAALASRPESSLLDPARAEALDVQLGNKTESSFSSLSPHMSQYPQSPDLDIIQPEHRVDYQYMQNGPMISQVPPGYTVLQRLHPVSILSSYHSNVRPTSNPMSLNPTHMVEQRGKLEYLHNSSAHQEPMSWTNAHLKINPADYGLNPYDYTDEQPQYYPGSMPDGLQ